MNRDFPGVPLVKTPNSGGMVSIPGWGTKIPYATWCGQKQTNKQQKKRQTNLQNKWITSMWGKGGKNGCCVSKAGLMPAEGFTNPSVHLPLTAGPTDECSQLWAFPGTPLPSMSLFTPTLEARGRGAPILAAVIVQLELKEVCLAEAGHFDSQTLSLGRNKPVQVRKKGQSDSTMSGIRKAPPWGPRPHACPLGNSLVSMINNCHP